MNTARRSSPRPMHLGGLLFLLVAMALLAGPALAQDDPYQAARNKMVDELIEREGVNNPAVLKSMRTVPRHLYVAPEHRAQAYIDAILDIGYKQTLSTGYIVAYMTQAVDPQPTDKVLEIGTGSGYQASILSGIVKEVYSIEIVEPLARQAAERLKKLGYNNVTTKAGDGFKGWPQHAPFDKIIVTCSPEAVPQPLADQLREGGKMIIPLGKRYHQAFYLFEKQNGKLIENKLLPTLFVPMTGMADELRKNKEDSAHPKIANGGFEESTDDMPDGWFYARQATLEHLGAKEGKAYMTFSNSEPGREAHILQAVGIDGSRVQKINISLWVRAEGTTRGQPSLRISFYDTNNHALGGHNIGPWVGTFRWKRVSKEINVPREAVMGMIQVGLRGAMGRLSIDDVRMTYTAR